MTWAICYIIILLFVASLSLSVSLWKCVTAVYGHPPGLRHKPGGTSLCIYASIGRTPHVPGIGISLLRPIPSHLFFIYHVGRLHRWWASQLFRWLEQLLYRRTPQLKLFRLSSWMMLWFFVYRQANITYDFSVGVSCCRVVCLSKLAEMNQKVLGTAPGVSKSLGTPITL